ncbi:hypothetical protein [Lysinibacillus odysseyi]|uniref:Phage head-tail adapter protein n=1 Tax=Lysinibacillus odysseyi 34hs-1 = NBRC 100172 TaxID=1220589 RepID=A0A0A3IZR8_9BACI|nr:hypothetical protein [Lysinibacillus odysseyi]KGR88403.1 hypothetical protein CD32_01710 [Lysinibacillus odysseyi 34hs-1 = NBRC 100172]
MVNKRIRDSLNDGFAYYGTKETRRSERGKRIGEKFVEMGRLAYQEMSSREQDFDLVQAMSRALDLKIRTLRPPHLDRATLSKLKMVIDGIEYDVIRVDSDREKRYLYFYLQEVGAFEQDKAENAGAD